MRHETVAGAPPKAQLGQRRGFDVTKLLVAFGIFASVALRNWDFVVYGAQYLMILAIFFSIVTKRQKFQAGIYLGFFGAFATWCLLSVFWAADQESALSGTLGILQFVFVGAAIAAYGIAERNPKFLLDCLAWAVAGVVVVLLVFTPFDVWAEALQPVADASSGENRLGYTVRYHPNALGRILAIGALIWVYKLHSEPSRKLLKVLIIGAVVATLLLTKSRLAIAMFIGSLILYFLISTRNLGRMVLALILLSIALAAGLWAVFNVPLLYDTFGFRFAAMLGLEGDVDASTSTRNDMLWVALDLFRQNPLLGVGLNNFSYYYFNEYAGWAATTAHSNFAEVLAGLGLLGIVTYYALPTFITFRLLRLAPQARRAQQLLVPFLLTLSLSQLLFDVGSISLTSEFVQLVTVVLFVYVFVDSNGRSTPGNADHSLLADAEPQLSDRRTTRAAQARLRR